MQLKLGRCGRERDWEREKPEKERWGVGEGLGLNSVTEARDEHKIMKK